MTLLQQIDKTVCMVLDKRFEYWRDYIQPFCKIVGLNPVPYIMGDGSQSLDYDYIDKNETPPKYVRSTGYATWWKPASYNIWRCHQNVVIEALKDGCQTLLILEDDIEFQEDFNYILQKVTPYFLENPWNMIYLGAYHNNTTEKIQNNVVRVCGSAGLHACIMNKIIMENIRNFPPLGPMDEMIGKYLHPIKSFNCYAIYPSIIIQKNGYSFIEGGDLEKPSRFQL